MEDRQVAMVTMNRGVGVVSMAEWNRLIALEKIYDSIAECTTWGEYRSLGCSEFDDEVLELADLEEFPGMNEAFDIDLRDRMGDEGPTLESSLESATLDFFEAAEDVEIDEEDLESWGPWAWVHFEAEERVRSILVSAGYTVEVLSVRIVQNRKSPLTEEDS